jgi:hypothetical protein
VTIRNKSTRVSPWPPAAMQPKILDAIDAWEQNKLSLSAEESVRILSVYAVLQSKTKEEITPREAFRRYMTGRFTLSPDDERSANEVVRTLLNIPSGS